MAPKIQPQEMRVADHLSLLKWKRQLRAILLTEDAWKVINGEMDKPTHQDPTDKIFRRDMDKWRKLNNVALGWMLLTLEDYSRQSIEKYKEPLDAMANLFKKFTPPFMTFDEFIGKDISTSPSDAPVMLVERPDDINSPSGDQRHEPRTELHRQASHNASNLVPNIAGVIEVPCSPRKYPRKQARSDDNRLTPNGIHNLVTRRELRSETQDSAGTNSTTLRNRLMDKIIGSKPTSPNPESDRASLTVNRAELAARPNSRENDFPQNNGPPRSSTFTDSNIVIPERNVSLTRSDNEREGPDRRNRRGLRGVRSEETLHEEGLYMMSGALQDVSREPWHNVV